MKRKNFPKRKNKRRVSALERLEAARKGWINSDPKTEEEKKLKGKKIKNLTHAITGTKNNFTH